MFLRSNKSFIFLFIILSYFGVTFIGHSADAAVLSNSTIQHSIIIDVRTPEEFADKSNPASINIPLNELETKFSIIDKEKTVIVCCASGRRSALAAAILKRHGFKNVVDAGSWRNTI
jgi:rhodanese-related sulfurtransferase